MADPEKKSGRPESPTTARELDFDDEDAPTSSQAAVDAPASTTAAPTSETPAAVPNAPADGDHEVRTRGPGAEAEAHLREAFPTIDAAVVKAVLVASGGQIEPAFTALLGMSDPDAAHDPAPPPQPPRPVAAAPPDPAMQSQMEADERYARELAARYQRQASHQGLPDSSRDYRGSDPRLPSQRPQTNLRPDELYDDREHSFIDDDLPVIRDNIRKGFLETQTRVNTFLSGLRKRLDGEEDEDIPPPQPPRRSANYRPSAESLRRTADRERYDADPQVLSDDFAAIHMQDAEPIENRSSRPAANPDLFKPTPNVPNDRNVASPSPPSANATPPGETSKKSKWQPLASADPNPVSEHDPFSLGDSDDEDPKKKDEVSGSAQAEPAGQTETPKSAEARDAPSLSEKTPKP